MTKPPQAFLSDLLRAVATIAPPALAESWDNVGLQVGHPAAPLHRVMTCLELTESTLAEAVELQADAIVAHHPLIFKPLSVLNLAQPGPGLLAELVRRNIALIAAHTNLDAAAWSTNHALAEACGLTVEGPMAPRELNEGEPVGLGLLALPTSPTKPDLLAHDLQSRLGLPHIRLSGPPQKKIKRIAVCGGSGGSFIGMAAAKADALITGEIGYHGAIEAHQRGIAVLELGHFESEVLVIGPLARRLSADPKLAEAGVSVVPARSDFQPFRWMN